MSQAQATPPPTQPSPPPRKGQPVLGLLTLVFRLLLLGVGGGAAWLIGVAIAQFIPASVTAPPLTERFIQQVESLDQGRHNLWTRFRTGSGQAAETPASPGSVAPLSLNPADQQTAQAEVDRLQEDLQRLRDRTTLLELDLGITPGVEPIDIRLQQLQQQIDPAAGSAVAPVAGEAGQGTLRITLPSDALFEADGQMLSPSASGILDSIARDLRAYPNSVMQVAAHTSVGGDANAQRVQSFAQASAVAQYLKQRLGPEYVWLTVGYGGTQPLEEEDNAQNPGRDRRIEIRIMPR